MSSLVQIIEKGRDALAVWGGLAIASSTWRKIQLHLLMRRSKKRRIEAELAASAATNAPGDGRRFEAMNDAALIALAQAPNDGDIDLLPNRPISRKFQLASLTTMLLAVFFSAKAFHLRELPMGLYLAFLATAAAWQLVNVRDVDVHVNADYEGRLPSDDDDDDEKKTKKTKEKT